MEDCERQRLERALEDAENAFEQARAHLRTRIGVSQKAEYDTLSSAVDEAWNTVQRARSQLDRYLRGQREQSAVSRGFGLDPTSV